MPVLINIAADLVLGSAMAWAARHSPAMQKSWLSWSTLALLAFEAICVTPMATFAFRFYPEWSTLYFIDPQAFPQFPHWVGWLSAIAILINFLCAMAGYLTTRAGILEDNKAMAYGALTTGASALVFMCVIFNGRIFFVGNYESFLAGEAELLVTTTIGIVGVLVYGLAAGYISWLRNSFAESDPSFL